MQVKRKKNEIFSFFWDISKIFSGKPCKSKQYKISAYEVDEKYFFCKDLYNRRG